MRRPFSHFQPLRSRHADVTFSHRRRQDGASNGRLYLGYPVSRAMSILPTAANVYSFGLGFSLSQRVVWNFRSLIFSFSQTWMNDNNSKKNFASKSCVSDMLPSDYCALPRQSASLVPSPTACEGRSGDYMGPWYGRGCSGGDSRRPGQWHRMPDDKYIRRPRRRNQDGTAPRTAPCVV